MLSFCTIWLDWSARYDTRCCRSAQFDCTDQHGMTHDVIVLHNLTRLISTVWHAMLSFCTIWLYWSARYDTRCYTWHILLWCCCALASKDEQSHTRRSSSDRLYGRLLSSNDYLRTKTGHRNCKLMRIKLARILIGERNRYRQLAWLWRRRHDTGNIKMDIREQNSDRCRWYSSGLGHDRVNGVMIAVQLAIGDLNQELWIGELTIPCFWSEHVTVMVITGSSGWKAWRRLTCLKDVVVDGKIVLNWILKKRCNKAWPGFVWCRIVTIGSLFLVG
jgi:hypothetical protein